MAHDTQITSSMRIDRALVNSTVNLELSISADSAPFYLFLYHRDRMLRAAEEFGWTEAAEAISGLHGACYLLNSVTTHLKGKGWDAAAQLQPLKVRLLIGVCRSGHIDLPGPCNALRNRHSYLHFHHAGR